MIEVHLKFSAYLQPLFGVGDKYVKNTLDYPSLTILRSSKVTVCVGRGSNGTLCIIKTLQIEFPTVIQIRKRIICL